jgi:hypothetical protein
MFAAGVMTGVARVAMSVACLVALEVVKRLCTPPGHRTMIAVARIIAVVDMPEEVVWPVEPRACAYEDAVVIPVRAIVAIGSTLVGRIVKISVRAYRSRSYPYSDRDLGRGLHRGS